jgi:hypothetical protein
MYPMISAELITGAMEIICYVFTVAASLLTYFYWLRV